MSEQDTVKAKPETFTGVNPEIVQEMEKFMGVVHDFTAIANKRKIEDLTKEVPEAARLDEIIKMLPTHFSQQLDELKSELNSVIEEVASEFYNFAYNMKVANTNVDNRRKDYQEKVDTTKKELSEANNKIKKLEEDNSYLREIVDLRKKLDETTEKNDVVSKPSEGSADQIYKLELMVAELKTELDNLKTKDDFITVDQTVEDKKDN